MSDIVRVGRHTDGAGERATAAAVNMVLEPMSRATQTLLQPPRLQQRDHLYLWIDEDERWLRARVRALDREGREDWRSPSYEAERFFNRVPERRSKRKRGRSRRHWNSGRDLEFELGFTDTTCLVISHCWPQERLKFVNPYTGEDDPLARAKYLDLLVRFFRDTGKARLQALFKSNKELPPECDDLTVPRDNPPADYQKLAALLALDCSFSLFLDRGVGKTYVGVLLMCEQARRKTDGMLRVLVVCPKQVQENWRRETIRFTTLPGKIQVCRGGELKRVKQLTELVSPEDDCEFGMAIVGYESLSASIEWFSLIPWDLVLVDESHNYRSSRTQRWRSLLRIRENSTQRINLTGSPMGNSPMELWTQLEFTEAGASGFVNQAAFKNFHGKWESVQGVPGVARLRSLQNVALLQERLARRTFQLTREEAGLDLPKVRDIVEVEMTESQAMYYEQMRKSMQVELEELREKMRDQQAHGDVGGATMTANIILTQLLRLSQITSGFLRMDDKTVRQINTVNPKVAAVWDDIQQEVEEDPLSKKIVWAVEKPSLAALYQEGLRRGIGTVEYHGGVKMQDRQDVVDAFNCDPEVKVLVGNQQTAGEGLDLIGYDKERPEESLTYTDHLLFFSVNWSPFLRPQAEDRAVRRGTRPRPVRITDYVVLSTVDELMRDRVDTKKAMTSSVMDITSILESVL